MMKNYIEISDDINIRKSHRNDKNARKTNSIRKTVGRPSKYDNTYF